MSDRRFGGRTVLITGSTGGIGRALAQRFSSEGANLVLVDLESDALARQCSELGAAATLPLVADVADEAQTEAAVREAQARWGGIDVAVLNAGIEGKVALVEHQPLAEFDRVMAVNVRGVFLWLAQVIPVMKKQRAGVITVMSSTGGLRGGAKMSPYVASKHAVIGLVKSAALEVARHGIRVNTINPGPIATRMMESIEAGVGAQAQVRARNVAGIPLNRYGTPEEVAALTAYLSSDEAGFATGSSYVLDGGGLAGKFG